VPGSTEIENYEPSDEGWGIVLGPFVRPPVEDESEDATDSDDKSAPA
jgi:hypothetical protein